MSLVGGCSDAEAMRLIRQPIIGDNKRPQSEFDGGNP